MTPTSTDPQQPADRHAWHNLALEYAFAVDRRDDQALVALFASGAKLVLPGELARGGRRDGFTELEPNQVVESVRRFVRTRHVVEQQRVLRDGGAATGETYCTAHHLYRRDGELRDYVMTIRYLDEFVATAAGWRFARRTLVVDWVEDRPVAEAGKA